MPRKEEKLVLGKGAAFVKSRLKRLRQEEETWEADFQALPKPVTQSRTDYLGMVVAPDGSGLRDRLGQRNPEPTTWAWSSPRTALSWPIPRSRAGPRSTRWPRCWPTPCGDH